MTRCTDVWSARCGWTATDCLLLDVEQVEGWCREVVADGDPRTRTLVSLVTRLRACADTLADYLYRTSAPAGECASARLGRTPRAPRRERVKQAPGRDSGASPQGLASGPERSGPEAPTSTNQGLVSADRVKGSFHE